jgi:hypothetical protein
MEVDRHLRRAVYGPRPALVIEMTGASFDRIVVACADAAEPAARGGHHPSRRRGARLALKPTVSQVLLSPRAHGPIVVAI